MKKFLILSFLLTLPLFSLTNLERDEVIFIGKGRIENGKYLFSFTLPKLKNSFYLNLKGLSQYQIFLNHQEIGSFAKQNFTTIDLTEKKDWLKRKNEILIQSTEEGKDFSFTLWQSDYRW
ncbi:MAG: hypothetical protein ABIK81_03005, partial [candidate division WOR-3 bacterium]